MFCVFSIINTSENQLRSLALPEHFPNWCSNATLLCGIRVFLTLEIGKDPSAVTAIHGYCFFLPFPIFVGQNNFCLSETCARSSPNHLQIVHSPPKPVQNQHQVQPHWVTSVTALAHRATERVSGDHTQDWKMCWRFRAATWEGKAPRDKIRFIHNSKWICNYCQCHSEGTSAVSRWLRKVDKWAQQAQKLG